MAQRPSLRSLPAAQFFAAALSLLVAIAIFIPSAARADDDEIRNVFESYKGALTDKRGSDAVQFVHARTIGYFGGLRKHALTAKAAQVRELSLFDQIIVLMLRQEFGERALADMSAADVFAAAVDRGLVGRNLDRLGVGEVKKDRKSARGRATRDGKPMPLYFEFRKIDDGTWRLDLANVIKLGNWALDQVRRKKSLSKTDFVMLVLGARGEGQVPVDLWDANPDR